MAAPFAAVRRAAMLAIAVGLIGRGSAMGEGPSELSAARSEYEGRLAGPRAKLDAAISSRVKRYVNDLKELETKSTAAGHLDAVVAIRAEREAYEKGARTNGFGSGNSKVPASARQLRATFDADLARARATVAPEGRAAATEYIRALSELERKLTSQKAVEAALAVRKEREETQTDGLDPLNPPATGLIGDWQQPASAPKNSRTGKVFTFRRDGTWRNSSNETGTWEWTDRSKRKIVFRWNEKPWSDPFTLSTDGKRLVGTDNQSNPLIMERLP